MAMFPDTPETLLKKIAELADGNDAAVWAQFVEIYTPPLNRFVREINQRLSVEEVEDAVQEVFVRLVAVLRRDGIDRRKGKFRAYLASMTRRILIDRYREELARPKEDGEPVDISDRVAPVIDPGAAFDIKWRIAVHSASVEHILTRTAVSERSRAVYREILAGKPLKDIAKLAGISYAAVKQIKSRIDRAVLAVERKLA